MKRSLEDMTVEELEEILDKDAPWINPAQRRRIEHLIHKKEEMSKPTVHHGQEEEEDDE